MSKRPSNTPKAEIQGDDFRRYDPRKYDLIPLHKPGATRTENKKGLSVTVKTGKRPLHPAWTSLKYDSRKVVAQCIADRRNMGVRLRPDQMAVDVDPRNGGTDSWAALCVTLGDMFEPTDYPCVTTGSGGLHVYMTVPPDLDTVETLEQFPGIEFKRHGRQVLASGSVHPDTGRPYVFTPAHPDINELKPAPKALLKLIKTTAKKRRAGTVTEGALSCELVAAFLEHIPADDFDSYNEWTALCAALKHATGGAALDQWLAWNSTNPKYDTADAQKEADDKWHSFKRTTGKLATIESLGYIGRKYNVPKEIMKPIRNAITVAAFADRLTENIQTTPKALQEPRPLDELLRELLK